ncbi:LysR family transcriptional regulator [Cupriavidus basilensis]
METLDRQLRYFLKIAELQSLSRAAEELDCTQPALSRQIASLEASIGRNLFNRTGRGMELTDAGCNLLAEVKPAFVAIDTAVQALRDQDSLRGTLKLASVHTLSYYFVGELVAHFSGLHPTVSLSVMGRGSPEVVALVETGRADLGLVYDTAVATDKVQAVHLFDDRMCLIVGHDCDLTGPVDLTQTLPRLVGFPQHYVLRKMVHSSGLYPQFVAEAETVDAMLKMVSAGVGACILPERIPDRLLSQYHLRKIPIARPSMCRRVVAIVRADRADNPLVRELSLSAQDVARSAGLNINSEQPVLL